LVRDLGLAGTVRFLGFRDDVADVLAAMDLLAHTSVEPEPFGRVLIEAMASGVPVVGAHAGAVPEIIQDGITGRLVPPGDPDALAVALIEALRSPKMRQRWRAAAQRDVHERFGVRAHVASVMAVYERVLSA